MGKPPRAAVGIGNEGADFPRSRRRARNSVSGDNEQMNRPCNIAARLPELARERPDQIAILPRRGAGNGMAATTSPSITASWMPAATPWRRSGRLRDRPRVRTVVMVRPSPEFFLLMFALFKLGAVPVLVDPGIDKRALKQCLDEAQPEAFIGIPLAHVARLVLRWAPSATRLVTVAASLGGTSLAALERRRQRWADAGRHRWRGHGRDPVHQWLHRRAQGRGTATAISSARSSCWAVPSAWKRAGWTCRPSAVCLVRPGAGPDLGDPGHGPDAAGAGRPGTPARCHPALRRDPAVWFARADAGAGEAWPAAADGDR